MPERHLYCCIIDKLPERISGILFLPAPPEESGSGFLPPCPPACELLKQFVCVCVPTITCWVKRFLLQGLSECPHQMDENCSLCPAELHYLVYCCTLAREQQRPGRALCPYPHFLGGGFKGLLGKIIPSWSGNVILCLPTNSHPAAADQCSWDGGD